jgi:prepilin-type N-terminal cleavage/methylation domain-containing protein
MKRQAGFTLVEIIAVLLIVAVVATVSGMAIVTGIKGYLFARDNASIGQKAQVTLSRLNREMKELHDVSVAEPSRITYKRLDGGTVISQTLYLDPSDDTIKIAPGITPEDGDTLVDTVSNFTLTYFKKTGVWEAGIDNIRDLYTIGIDLYLARTEDNSNVQFFTMVNPRNIKPY